MHLTKNQMARVIVQALYALPELPATDHHEVVLRTRRGNVDSLTRQHKLACDVLSNATRMTLPLAEVPPGPGWEILSGNNFQNVWVREAVIAPTAAKPLDRPTASSLSTDFRYADDSALASYAGSLLTKATHPVSVRIEMDRGNGWETRQAGELAQDRAAIIATIEATLPAYCVQFAHRALVDGVVVAEARP